MSAGGESRRNRFPLPLHQVAGGDARTPGRPLLRPQAPLDQAARDASRGNMPSGIGLDSDSVRERMVQRLRAEGVACEPVLAALRAVPRHLFVDTGLATQAYEDTSLPIGHGQTISKPSVVARMIGLLFEGATARARGTLGRTLEIGTGCGYQAALLAEVSRSVVSVERLKPLFEKAQHHLAARRPGHLRLVFGDGLRGHPPNAPYDSIIAAAGGDSIPDAWLEQLAPGGRLVAPVAAAGGSEQVLLVIDRDAAGFSRAVHEPVRFVPLKSGVV